MTNKLILTSSAYKVLTFKIMPVILIICFLFSNISYGIDVHRKSHLRPPLLGNSKEGAERGEISVYKASDAISEDLPEAQQIRFRFKPQRELNERHAEINALKEIQIEIRNLIKGLSIIMAEDKIAKTAQDKINVEKKRDELLKEMRKLYVNMPVEIRGNRSISFYSKALKDLKDRRNRKSNKIRRAHKEHKKKVQVQENRAVIRINRIILKLQILIAGIFLKSNHYTATFSTLNVGALNTAEKLEAELSLRIGRLSAQQKRAEFMTANREGRLVLTSKLEVFDIQIIEGKEGEEPRVRVRRQVWIRPKTRLAFIQKTIKKGGNKKAIEMLDELIQLYNVRYIIMKESYQGIASDLKVIREITLGLPESQAPPKEEFDLISNKIETLIGKITQTRHKIWKVIEYKSRKKLARGKRKTIKWYQGEYIVILRNIAFLDYYAKKFERATKKGYLSRASRNSIRLGITDILEWVKLGDVYPKQLTIEPTETITKLLKLLDKDDIDANTTVFGQAGHFCREGIKQLKNRLKEMDRIMLNVTKSLDSADAESRDTDISRRADKIIEALNTNNIKSAVLQINELRELYFKHELVEPGYIRAERLLRQVTRIARSVDRSLNKNLTIQRIANMLNMLNELKQDITHKRSFKITVTHEDGKSKKFFINPGTTVLGLLNLESLQRNPDTTLVTIGEGWIPRQNLDKVKLREGAQVLLKSKEITPTEQSKQALPSNANILNVINPKALLDFSL